MKLERIVWNVILFVLLACSSFGIVLRSDINKDGRVDFLDFSIMAEEWMLEEEIMANSYLNFTGDAAYIEFADNDAFKAGNEDFTICFWAKPSTSNAASIFSRMTEAGDAGYIVGYGIGGQTNKYSISITDGVEGAVAGSAAVDGNWQHLAFVINRSEGWMGVYLNGVEYPTVSILSVGSIDGAGDVFVGFSSPGTLLDYKGALDDFRVFKSALSVYEIRAIYRGGFGSKYYGAEAQGGDASVVFEFDEARGTTVNSTILTSEADISGTFSGSGVAFAAGGIPVLASPSISTIPNEAIPATSSSSFVSKNLYAEEQIGSFTNDNIPRVCKAFIQIGDSTDSSADCLCGTGGTYQITIFIDSVPIFGHPKDLSIGTENAYTYWTEEFLVPADAFVLVYLKSPNASETAVNMAVSFFDLNQGTVDAITSIRKVVDRLTFTDYDVNSTDADTITKIDAIQAQTDQISFNSDGEVLADAGVVSVDVPAVEEIADAVWDEDITEHTTVDTAGAAVSYIPDVTDMVTSFYDGGIQLSSDQPNYAPAKASDTIAAVTSVIGIATGGITAGSFANDSITANAIADDAITAARVADDVSTEIAAKVKTTIEAAGSSIAAIKEQTDKLTFDSDNNLMTDSADAVVTGLLAAPEFARLVPGTGAYEYEFNVKYDGTVASIPDVSVYIYNASTLLPTNIVAYGLSNNQGVVNFYLNAGTYYAVQVKAGYTFENPETITVEAT